MYFRTQTQQKLLNIDSTFAHLANVLPNGDLDFEFVYSISQSDVVQNNAQRVTVTVETKTVPQKPLLGKTQRGQIDTKGLVNNIRTALIDAKSVLQQRLKYVVATRDSDITAYINNEVLGQLKARAPTSQIPAFNQTKLVLTPASQVKASNDAQPVLHTVTNSAAVVDISQVISSSAGETPQALMYEMIVRQGLDPSYIVNLTSRASPEDSTRGGLSNPQQAYELPTDPSARLLNLYLFPPTGQVPPTTTDELSDTDQVQVLSTVTSDELTVPVRIVLPRSRLRLEGSDVTQVLVTFDLISASSNLPLDTVVMVLDLSKHLSVYYTPRIPPQVKAATAEGASRVNLEITQVDPGATEVLIYRKVIWIASTEIDSYDLIGTYSLSASDQALSIQLDLPVSSPALYRVIPQGNQSMESFEFTNVAVKPGRYTPQRAVALTATQVNTGFQLEIRHIPLEVIAIQLLRWNLSTFQKCPDTVNGDVGFIDDATRQADLLTAIDTSPTAGNVYRYVARLLYKDGNHEDFGDATLEFVLPAPGAVATSVTDLAVATGTAPDVSFTLVTSTSATSMDAVKAMLEAQGLSDLFQGDVAAQRDQLQQLIAHSVQRIDLNTGTREDFGVVTTSAFADGALGKNQNVQPLEYGHCYRYEIYPLLRAPETMFDALVKTTVDAVTKKTYSYSPAKFLHPLALSAGTLVSAAGAAQRYAKQPMAFGVVGSITTIDVSFDQDIVQVQNQVASQFDRYLNIVSWGVQGDISQIDHFLVFKQVHGIRTLLGKAHSDFANGTCQYVHAFDQHDVGSLTYVIIPIMSDYKVGVEALTNSLVVEAP